MQIINQDVERKIKRDIISYIIQEKYAQATKYLLDVLDELYENIPENKRISFGRVYTLQVLSRYLFSKLVDEGVNVCEVGATLFGQSEDFRGKGIALGILSHYGVDDYKRVLPFFEASASSSDWNMRELAQAFFRELIKKWPEQMRQYLLNLTESREPKIRRFVSETLRPVKENRWFYEKPDYSLSILRNLFRERSEYPRTSVGNNLSDLARHLPDLVLNLVAELVASGDLNSYWIAYRACRNLVKKSPLRVMNLLGVDEYRYKKRVYRRSEYQRN